MFFQTLQYACASAFDGNVAPYRPCQPSPLFNCLYDDECAEIQRHKWYESEKVGYDIGLERARFDWTLKHRNAWLASWMRERKWEHR
jgi:hypothetical protein